MTTMRKILQFPIPNAQSDEDWRTEGECRQGHDPEIWYPHNVREAWLGVAICDTCPVQMQCLMHAEKNQEIHGTWGGLTEWQRRNRRRRDRGVV